MINQKIVNIVLKAASNTAKDIVITEILKHIALDYDYNDKKASHVLEILADPESLILIKDINLDYIKEHLNLLMYNPDNYIIKDIKVIYVNNIAGYAGIEYKYLEKINEDRGDIDFSETHTNISFIDNPEILKDVKS